MTSTACARPCSTPSWFLAADDNSIKTLISDCPSRSWVREAFGHSKALAAAGAGIKLVEAAISELEGYQVADAKKDDDGLLLWYDFTATNARLNGRVKIAEGSKGFLEQFFWQVNLHQCRERELDGYSSMVSM